MYDKLSLWKRWAIENHTRGVVIYDVQPASDDSWLWKCLIQSIGEFQCAFYEQTGGGETLEWESFCNANGKINYKSNYEMMRKKGKITNWVIFFGRDGKQRGEAS